MLARSHDSHEEVPCEGFTTASAIGSYRAILWRKANSSKTSSTITNVLTMLFAKSLPKETAILEPQQRMLLELYHT